jgi:hypothetical protein
MTTQASSSRRAALVASAWRLPLALVHPVVLTFVTGAVFSYLSGDTVRAGYLLAVGLALAGDHAHRRAVQVVHKAPASSAGAVFSHHLTGSRRAAMNRLLISAVIAGAGYAAVVGWFQRYSWPATVAVTLPAVGGVLVAWLASAGSHNRLERLPVAGIAAWTFVWAGAAAWELTALYLQPNLDAVLARIVLGLLLVCVAGLAHTALGQRRMKAWDFDWQITEPQWTRRR